MNQVNLIEVLQRATPIAMFVLAVLLVFSIWSWGIILSKALLLRKVNKESETFWKMFRSKGQSLSEIATACETLHFTPLVPVFNAGAELLRPRAGKSQAQGMLALKSATASSAAVQRTLQRAAAAQVTRLENRMTFLATTATVAPFIGLFGTVLGVMDSFAALGNVNVASLQIVAPGMSEALVATALGLFAAIPSVVAYNHFIHKIRMVAGQLDDLQVDLLAIAEGDEV